MIFDRLANIVVKRYVLIVLIWAVVIFYAFPLALKVGDVVAYQETEFIGDVTFESQLAEQLKDEQFPIQSAEGSSLLLVLMGDDLLSAEGRDFTLDLSEQIRSSPELKHLQEVTSVYDVYSVAMEAVVCGTAPAMHELRIQTALSLELLYELPQAFFVTFDGVNATAAIVYGIPSVYLISWTATDDSLPGEERDETANASTSLHIEQIIDTEGIDQANATLMRSYYAAFYGSWVALRDLPPFSLDPMLRLNQSVDLAVQSLADSLPPSYGEARSMLLAVHGNLSFLDYHSPLTQSDLAAAMVSEATTAQMDDDPMSGQIAQTLLYLTNSTWKASLLSFPDIDAEERAATVLPLVHGAFLDALPPESQEHQFFSLLLSSFNRTTYSEPAAIHQLVLEIISAESGIADMAFLQSVYELGPAPSAEEMSSLVWSVIRSYVPADYPVELPMGLRSSFVGEDNRTMLILVAFTEGAGYRDAGGGQPIVDNVKIIREISRSLDGRHDGVKTYVTGEAAITSDLSGIFDKDMKLIEPATIILVLLLMSFFFRSVLAPFIPLGAIGIALGISQAVVLIVGTTVASVHFTVLTLLVTILFGVGVDYSIFILARYREERIKGADGESAMRTSITWAGESIATSGATVIISFGAISISTFSMLRTMGLVLGIAILIALLVSLTLVPAIALLLRRRVFWPTSGQRWTEFRMRYLKRRAERRGGYFRHAARFSVRHPWPIIAVALLISIPTTYISLDRETSYDFIGGMGESESVDGLYAMSESFGAGLIAPTEVLVQFDREVALSDGSFDIQLLDVIEELADGISRMDNVHQVDSPTRPAGLLIPYQNLSSVPEPERSSIIASMRSLIGLDNRTVLVKVVFSEEPYTVTSLSVVRGIRSMLADMRSADPALQGATVLVGGQSAGMLDVDDLTSKEFRKMQVIVVIGVFIVLLIVLGSLVMPLFAILSIALSISWTLAVTLLLFDILFAKPVLWMLPIVLFVILMGLGMDYNIFILTRVREEVQKRGNHTSAIVEAVDRTGGIITACAVIMAGAFGTMMLSSTAILQQFGFALSFAVLLDAMLVRTYLMPAIMTVLGPKWTWWAPGRLQRVRLLPEAGDRLELDDQEL